MITATLTAAMLATSFGWTGWRDRRRKPKYVPRHARPADTPPSWRDRPDGVEAERYGRHDPSRTGRAARSAA
jgi:hypothetical protein